MTDLEKYDFLYIDYDRICSMITATSGTGHITAISEITNQAITQNSSIEGSIPPFAKGNTGSSQTDQEEKAVQYGIYWHNVYKFITHYGDMMVKNIDNHVNKITYSEGKLTVYDTQQFSKAMADGLGEDDEEEPMNLSPISHFLDVIVGSLSAAKHNYWFTLKRDNMKSSMPDLTLKYGLSLGAGWCAFSIIDTIPQEENTKHSRFLGSEKGNDFEEGIIGTVKELRKLLGKPTGFIGITPIIIFRKLDDLG